MNIYVNNKVQELTTGSKIADALIALEITSQKGIAVAVNNNVIPRSDWDRYELKDEDKVTLIRAAQGG